jgi:hypothetical protein
LVAKKEQIREQNKQGERTEKSVPFPLFFGQPPGGTGKDTLRGLLPDNHLKESIVDKVINFTADIRVFS